MCYNRHYNNHKVQIGTKLHINVVCCVGRVEIQIEIQKGRCNANTDSIV